MLSFVTTNGSTIVIGLGLLAAVVAIATQMIRNHKKGASGSCGCSCGNCPNSSACRPPHSRKSS